MRISMPFGLSNTWISRALAQFAVRYPDVHRTLLQDCPHADERH